MKIDIKDYKLLCHKGSGEYNEDIVRVCKYGAWILDGSTGLNKKNFNNTKYRSRKWKDILFLLRAKKSKILR